MKNYLWNMFANIQNGQLVKRTFIVQDKKKICEAFLNILWDEGFISGYKILENDSNKLKIILKYNNGKPVINSLKFMSKPGRKIYYSLKQLWKIDSTKTFLILSTNRGLKSIVDCKKLKIGGKPFVIIN
jgi:small subunit ribosomal protein S8